MTAARESAAAAVDAAAVDAAAGLSELLGHVSTNWDNERRGLARQLHDSMGSSLTALSMHLSLLATQMPQERALQDRVAQMKQLLQNVIESNREMQMKLWNDKLEFLGAGVALAELAARFGEGGDVTVRCSLPEDELDCPRAHGVALLRTLEEGLSNIAAHALASEVDIVVDDNEDALTLTVKDNGVGAPGAAAESGDKHGLRALRERLRYLGGNLTLTANAPRGSILTATLPKSAAR